MDKSFSSLLFSKEWSKSTHKNLSKRLNEEKLDLEFLSFVAISIFMGLDGKYYVSVCVFAEWAKCPSSENCRITWLLRLDEMTQFTQELGWNIV